MRFDFHLKFSEKWMKSCFNSSSSGEYVIIVEDVTEPPFFGTRLEPAFLRVELNAPKRERRSTTKKVEEKKK